MRLHQSTNMMTAGVPTGLPAEMLVGTPAMAVSPTAGLEAQPWVPIGPSNIGGRVRSIVISPSDPAMIWTGSTGGGIWKSVDEGVNWHPADDMMANLAISCMVMDPNDENLIYAGTGEGFSNFDAIRGAGIFFTQDGNSWNHLGSTRHADFQYVNRLAISSDSLIMLAATNNGMFRSDDAGRSNWSRVLADGVADVRCHPADSNFAVAGGLDNGLAWYTTDGGVSWVQSSNLPGGRRIELTYALANPDIVYASVDIVNGQLWRSDDGGATFTKRDALEPNGDPAPYLGDQGWYDNTIWAGDPTDPELIIVGGIDLWRSSDGGQTCVDISTWHEPDSVHADHHVIVSHPDYDGDQNRIVYFGNDGGVYRTQDSRTAGNEAQAPKVNGWENLTHTLAVTQFYSGAGNVQTGTIIGGGQDNGTLSIVNPSMGQDSWQQIFGGDGGYCASDPTDPAVFYGEYVYLNIHRNEDGATTDDLYGDRYISGQFWDSINGSWNWKPFPYQIPDAFNQRALFIAPFVLDPNESNRILAGGESLWRTNDAKTTNTSSTGPSWKRIKSSAGTYNRISAIAVVHGNSDRVWVGYKDGQLFSTGNATDQQPAWQRVDSIGSAPISTNRFVTAILVPDLAPATVYVALGGYMNDNLWRSTDDGVTWQSLGGMLPEAPVRAIAVHPDNPDWIYVGTEVGLVASDDGGVSWSLTSEGPANCSVRSLFWMDKVLICVTYGRGMFAIDLS